MAPRERKSSGKLKSNEERWAEGIHEVLNYLFRPILLPDFTFNPLTFRQSISTTIDNLIAEALERALPPQTLGVQFVYAQRPLHTDGTNRIALKFDHPLIMRGSPEERIALADGLSYVTHLLNTKSSPSFHSRVRRRGLTEAPAVCVFTDDDIEFDHLLVSAMNVIHVKLSPAGQINRRQVNFPAKQIEPMAGTGGRLFCANLLPAADSLLYVERRIEAQAYQNKPLTEILCVANGDPDRRERLMHLVTELGRDATYLERVRYLLRVGNIILCTPHSYSAAPHDSEEPASFNEQIADSGLTVILSRNVKIQEIDWVRVQMVAQKLAIFAGAALSTADRARAHIVNRLSRSVRHEFSSSATSIHGIISQLKDLKRRVTEPDVKDVNGRLEFTSELIQAALFMEEESNDGAEEIIKRLTKPLQKYKDLELVQDLRIPQESSVSGMWCIVIVEALRNAYKHSKPTKAGRREIKVTAQNEHGNLILRIENRCTHDGGINSNSEGLKLMEEIAHELGGSFKLVPGDDQMVARVTMPLVRGFEKAS